MFRSSDDRGDYRSSILRRPGFAPTSRPTVSAVLQRTVDMGTAVNVTRQKHVQFPVLSTKFLEALT